MMKFHYLKNGKTLTKEIPKNNNKLPKTKRLRKKKMWLKCGDCTHWFKRYEKTHGIRVDGKKVCHTCLMSRIKQFKQSRPDLFTT